MRQIEIEVSDETLAMIDAEAAAAAVPREQWVAVTLDEIVARRRAKGERDAAIKAEYDAYATSCDTSPTLDDRARQFARMRDVEW